MAIIVSAPDAFFDAEPWTFDLVINAVDGLGPLDLTGSRLYASFLSLSDNAAVGICDTSGADGSLTITDAPAGKVRFRVPNADRTWRLPAIAPGALMLRSTVVGDLYRLAGGEGAAWDAIARIEIGVLPSTGLPKP